AFSTPRAAMEAGVSIVYQETSALPEMTVAENIFLGREPTTRLGLVDRRRLYEETRRLLDRYHLPLDPAAQVGRLPVAGQQLVEIARALSIAARVLILDEPTAVLSLAEQRNLFDIIAGLKGPRLLILYVSHRLEEIFTIADRITVLRDGRKVTTVATTDLRQADLVRLMVGHEVRERVPLPAPAGAPPLLEARLTGNPPRLEVRGGEILGFAGLVGAGAAILERLRLRARSLAAPVRELSGGNQQKVIFGRALLCRPRILVCDEPTRGVDVGAKDEIYDLLLELARQGVAIVLISSELKEVLALSHRVLVMRDGAAVREFTGGEANEQDVLLAAMGSLPGAA